MYLKIKEDDFNRLTEAYIRIQCCAYLLQGMETEQEGDEEWAFSPFVALESRLFLLDTLVKELGRLSPVLLAITPEKAPPQG